MNYGISIGVRPTTISFVLFVSSLLISLSGDVHVNPGPVKVKSISMCHTNIRGLSSIKLSAIKTSLCNKYDIITLSDFSLST